MLSNSVKILHKFNILRSKNKSTEGRCIHMMHIGSFDNETISFSKMEEFGKGKGLIRKSKNHREIYISDFRKVPKKNSKLFYAFNWKTKKKD